MYLPSHLWHLHTCGLPRVVHVVAYCHLCFMWGMMCHILFGSDLLQLRRSIPCSVCFQPSLWHTHKADIVSAWVTSFQGPITFLKFFIRQVSVYSMFVSHYACDAPLLFSVSCLPEMQCARECSVSCLPPCMHVHSARERSWLGSQESDDYPK